MTVNTVHHKPATELLDSLSAESVDLIVTDPPYGIGYKSSWKTTNGHKPRQFSNSFGDDVLQVDWIKHAERVMKANSSMYIFTRWDVLHHTLKACEDCGLKPVQRIIWDKKM